MERPWMRSSAGDTEMAAHTSTIDAITITSRAVRPIFKTAGPVFLVIKVSTQRYPMSSRLRDGAHIKNRFRENLLGQAAFD